MDWQRFLEENNIPFITRGPNTKRGELSVHCPFCGEEDPSEHLGIDPLTDNWGCLRDGSHRGKSPKHLVRGLLSCSTVQAELIVKQYSHSDPDSLESAIAMLSEDAEIKEDKKRQHDLKSEFGSFKRIKPRGVTERFYRYLEGRGFENVHDLLDHYDLRAALTGRYKDRVILPVKMNGELLGWTSRAITKTINAPRYLASSEDVKTVIYNYDELKRGGDRLFIVEGPFDALKMDHYSRLQYRRINAAGNWIEPPHTRYRVTCTFGTSVTIPQIILLRELKKLYHETYVLFDKGADGPANELAEWVGCQVAHLPIYVDDPGELKIVSLAVAGASWFRGTF